MRYEYPAITEQNEDGSWTVRFEGLPGATDGDTLEEAMREAQDLLVTALSFFVDEGQAIPAPGPAADRPMVRVPMLESAKLALHTAMVEQRVSNAELARRMGITESIVRRLRDLLHESKIARVEAGLAAVGRIAVVEVEELATA